MGGIGGFLNDIGSGVAHGLEDTVQGLNVVDRYINPFHEEQTLTPAGKAAAQSGQPQSRGLLAPGLEDTMQGMRWLYDNYISRPISTAMMAGELRGGAFSTENWMRSWRAAQHVSPGQAFFLSPQETEQAVDSPLLYYKPPEAYLPPGFDKMPEGQQQDLLKQAGMPAIGNRFIQAKQDNSAWYKYGTGALDFVGVMFTDPTTLGLGIVGKGVKLGTMAKMPKGGWSVDQIDQLMSAPKIQAMKQFLWRNKDNPQLIYNTKLAQRSGMGPALFSRSVSQLNSPDELDLFMRVGMGDGVALDDLTAQNAAIKARMVNQWSRLSGLGVRRAQWANNPQIQALIDAKMAQVQQGLQADGDLMLRYTDLINNQGLLDELHYSRWGLRRAEDMVGAQNEYLAGPARGAVSGLVRGQRRAVSFTPSPGPVTSANYVPQTINSGVVHSRLWGGSDFFQSPLTVIRSIQNMHPNGYMRIDTIDKDSVNELRGQLARIPGWSPQKRADIINDYLKTTTEHDRKDIVEMVGREGAAQVARRYGVDPNVGRDLWRKHADLQASQIAQMQQRFTAATDPERVGASGQRLHLDELPDTGGKISVTPFTATRLMNGHTFQDLDAVQKVIARHGGRLEMLRSMAGGAKDWVETAGDYANFLWKFTTLFRLGYIPRVLGDDLGSQWAAAGTAAMALRTARGVKNFFDNAARWIAKPALQAREENALQGADYAKNEMEVLRPQINRLQRRLFAEVQQRVRDVNTAFARNKAAQAKVAQLDPADLSPKANAVRQFANQRAAQLRAAQLRHQAGVSPGKSQALNSMLDRHDFLSRYHDLSVRAAQDYRDAYQKVIQGSEAVNVDGHPWPAAFHGRSGQYALDQISADDSVGSLFARNKQVIQGNLQRSFDHGGVPISAVQDPEAHLEAWTHAINNVIMQDPMQKQFITGGFKSIQDAVDWMTKDPFGRRYRARLPKMTPTEEIARSAKYEVDQYMHTPEIRQKAMEDPDGVTPGFLKRAVPSLQDRPDVHTGQLGLSQLDHMNALDRVIARWYNFAATLPANRMSRHPLFNQFYEGHVSRFQKQWQKQLTERYGTNAPTKMSVEETDRLAHNARQLALRDTRALVFDIAHRSDAAAALRFMSPFFAATGEAFQRWGRVIADKPHIVGYMGNFYNAPAYLGAVQDQNGNHVDGQGYTYLPQWALKADGTPDYSQKPKMIKTLVPKDQRFIITRMPKWLVDSPLGAALNIRESEGKMLLSQNSIDLLTQGDPWFSPGFGPAVQIPVNEFVKDKLAGAKLARELGILPFGVQGGTLMGENPFGRALSVALPAQIRNLLTAYDTSDSRYQNIKMQIMNRAIYEHDQLGKPMPSAQEIADRVKNYWLFAASASVLQPFATQRKDPYQFYYDQYHNLRNQNPLTADDEFLKRFGESLFVFASEITKSQGIPPTEAAVTAMKKYGKYIQKHPDLAPLLIGPEGKGPFSPDAYNYELNNPLVPGSAEMMRGKITADEALKDNRRRLGWAKYTRRMNDLTSRLYAAGFQSYDDPGAEDFKNERRAWTDTYANPLLPDGTPNPYFNKDWADDFNTYNNQKYNELIPALMDIAASPLSRDPQRTDIQMLKQYLGGRLQLVQQLNEMKQAGGSNALNAQSNADIRLQWAQFVWGLIEKSPRFGDLYHRYLSRDMGVDAETEGAPQ